MPPFMEPDSLVENYRYNALSVEHAKEIMRNLGYSYIRSVYSYDDKLNSRREFYLGTNFGGKLLIIPCGKLESNPVEN